MTADVLRDLIARLEKAEGPDRELDLAIAVALRALPESLGAYKSAKWSTLADDIILDYGPGERKGFFDPSQIAPYTRSVDAAITLVPNRFIWDVTSSGAAWVMDAVSGEQWIGKAETPAVALTIAALQATGRLHD